MTDKQREGVRKWIEELTRTLEVDCSDEEITRRCFDKVKVWLEFLKQIVTEEPQDTMNIVQVQFYSNLDKGMRYTFRIPKGVKVKEGEFLRTQKGYLVKATADSFELPTELIETWIMGGRKVTDEITTRLREERLDG